jgi:hypothetical protein
LHGYLSQEELHDAAGEAYSRGEYVGGFSLSAMETLYIVGDFVSGGVLSNDDRAANEGLTGTARAKRTAELQGESIEQWAKDRVAEGAIEGTASAACGVVRICKAAKKLGGQAYDSASEAVGSALDKAKDKISKSKTAETNPSHGSQQKTNKSDSASSNSNSNEVILDTNAVKGYKDAQKQLKLGETPVVTKQTIKELEELRDRPSAKAFTQDTVDFGKSFKVVDDVDTLDSLKKVRKRQIELTETSKLKKQGINQEFPDANKIQGLEGDGIIGSTVLETKRPIITGDKDFADTLESLGAEVRRQ